MCGINDDSIQKRLLAEPNLTYKRAVELARGLETADRNVKLLKSGATSHIKRETPLQESPQVNRVASNKGSTAVIYYRCGIAGHTVEQCRYSKDIVCHGCRKAGHLQRACKGTNPSQNRVGARKKDSRPRRPVRHIEEEGAGEEDVEEATLFRINASRRSPPIEVHLLVDNCCVRFEVDTGAAKSVMSQQIFNQFWLGRSLETTKVRLVSSSNEPIPVVGQCTVNIAYNSQNAVVPLIVVKGKGPSLFGRNWLTHIRLEWQEISYLPGDAVQPVPGDAVQPVPGDAVQPVPGDAVQPVPGDAVQPVLDKYPSVFQEGLGKLQGFKAKIHVDPNAEPRFFRPRSMPYAVRDKVEKELARLQEEGTIEAVEVSDWAAPIVPVINSDKSTVRICGDFRVTVNPVSKLDSYPLPRVDDLFARLEGGQKFTKLDLSQAYQQLPLDEESKRYTVVNTHKGLFRYVRLPFGISSAPGIFQRVMDTLLQGIPGVVAYIDDILVTGPSDEEHLKALDETLSRLDKAGLRAQLKKCKFMMSSVDYLMMSSVDYLGYQINSQGLHPISEKIDAIKQAPSPQSVSELKSYLGLLTYYAKFMPNLSTALFPLYRLLKKDTPWSWGHQEEQAFQHSKELLTATTLLVHYSSS